MTDRHMLVRECATQAELGSRLVLILHERYAVEIHDGWDAVEQAFEISADPELAWTISPEKTVNGLADAIMDAFIGFE